MAESSRQFFRDLLGGPFRGHGVRVSVPGPQDRAVLAAADPEARAQMALRAWQWDLHCAEAIGDDRVPMLHLWSGTEVFAAAFGSPVRYQDDEMPFALPAVETAQEAANLADPDITAGSLGEVFALGDRMLELSAAQPGIPLRICDVQSPFDIAALIWRKESFFRALVEDPAAVHRLLDQVTRTMIRFIAAFKARYPEVCLVHFPELWMPPEWGICLSEDDIGSISAAHFRTFCLPYLRQLATAFGGISMHSCASGQHQWPAFLELPGLRYLNLYHPPTSLARAISTFSGHAVLVSVPQATPAGPYDGHAGYLDYVRECLRLALPSTRFFFMTSAPTVEEARNLTVAIKALCGRA